MGFLGLRPGLVSIVLQFVVVLITFSPCSLQGVFVYRQYMCCSGMGSCSQGPPLWRDSVVKISKDAVKVVKSSNNKGSKMVVTSSKNVVRIFFAFTTLTATKKAYRILPHLWKILEKSGISPLFSWLQLLLFTTFYCQTGKKCKKMAVKSLAVKL